MKLIVKYSLLPILKDLSYKNNIFHIKIVLFYLHFFQFWGLFNNYLSMTYSLLISYLNLVKKPNKKKNL